MDDRFRSLAYQLFFFFQAEDGIRDVAVTGVQTCALPISPVPHPAAEPRHPRHPARGDHAPVHQVHRADAGAAAGARGGVSGDGRDAGGDQVADAPAAAEGRGGGRGGPARGAGAAASGKRALQARRRRDRQPAAPGARRVADARRAEGPPPARGAAADRAAGDAGRVQGSRGALGDVRPPSHPARAPVGGRAHERHPRAAGGRLGVRALRPAVPAGGRAHGRHGHLRRGARAPARGADRDRAGRGLRPAARARREPRAGLARGSWPRCGARGRRPPRTARRTGSPMSDSYLRNVIEAALLAAGAPLPVAELTRLLDESARPSVQQVRAVVAALAEEYSGRGIELKETAGGFRIQVRRELAGEISRLWPERATRYSRALLETLALIAYRQPVTRAEIEAVRGVAVNPNIIRTLIERNWVRVVGHRNVPGHPELLGTTREFLDYFGLKSLDELPPLAELKAVR